MGAVGGTRPAITGRLRVTAGSVACLRSGRLRRAQEPGRLATSDFATVSRTVPRLHAPNVTADTELVGGWRSECRLAEHIK